ncbi:glycine-rich domain-containing protein [Helicobacter vulpis]|uniref:hypothetical protein n=1 Tax=Helicobacter vulpis TaxID=2316076 RepID=UPI001968E497|nr:hypothetical protein [Helicobacter vulpis]
MPPKDVDAFWHYHILDTQKCAQDCQEIFGYFLHHFPYFGMRGDQDAQNLQDSWNSTCQKYLARFGMPSALVQKKFGALRADVLTAVDLMKVYFWKHKLARAV